MAHSGIPWIDLAFNTTVRWLYVWARYLSQMIRRIWRGQIGLAWAFWGVGMLGLYPLIAVLLFFGSTPVKSLAIVVAIVPTIVIWRSANRSSSRVKRFIAKSYVIAAPFVIQFVVLAALLILMQGSLVPEHEEDTPELLAEAPAKFLELTGIEFPKRGRLAHAVYYRNGTLDYEFGSHIVVDVSDLDIREWVRVSRPFGIQLETTLPEDQELEFNATGLNCTLPKLETICSYVAAPTPTWHYQKRLALDRVVSITVFEAAKVIWLYETSW